MTNNKNNTIALFSSHYLFRDPRYHLFAQSYQKAGYKVLCVNLMAPISDKDKQSEFYKNFNCISFYDSNADSTIASNQLSSSSLKKLKSVAINISNSFIKKIKSFLITYCLNMFLYKKILKLNLFIKETFLRPVYIYITHKKLLKIISSSKFKTLINNVDMSHGCEFFFGAFIAYYTNKNFNIPYILDAKEHHRHMVPEFSNWTRGFIKKHEKVLFQNAFIIPCVTKPIIECYQKIYPNMTDKFFYMPNTQKLSIAKNTPNRVNTQKIKLIVLANYLPFVRGIEYIISVWNKLDPNNAELDLYLSNLNSVTQKYLLELAAPSLGKSLFIQPPVKEDDINYTISKYDIGIIPYLPNATVNHLYCGPNKFGQYLKSGLAILSSDTVNIPNQIAENNLGWVYPTNLGISAAADTIYQVLSSLDSIKIAQRHALEYYSTSYNWENYCAHYLEKLSL